MKTDAPIVLTIFGNERCVVMLDDLEAAANAIHQKAVRERETSGNPSTLGAEIEGQISPINEQSGASETKAKRNSAPALDEMFVWLDALRKRSGHLDDSTPAKAWDWMLRAFALQTALRSDTAHPDFREAATVNLRRLVRELQQMGV
jgi:hypothetical protein